jgi:hypothetical protein
MVFPHIFIECYVDKNTKICLLIFANAYAESDIPQRFRAADGAIAWMWLLSFWKERKNLLCPDASRLDACRL